MKFLIPLLKSHAAFYAVASFLILSLFLPSGFVSVASVVFFIYCCLRCEWNFNWRVQPLLFIPIALFLLSAMGCLYAPEDAHGWSVLLRKLPMLILPLGFLLLNKDHFTNIDGLLAVFLCACITCSLFCYTHAILNIIQNHSFKIVSGEIEGDLYYYSYRALAAPSRIDPIYLSLYFDFALIIALGTPYLKNKILKAILIGYVAFFILLLASKIGIIILAIIIVAWIYSKRASFKIAFIVLLLMLPIFFIGTRYFPFLQNRFTTTASFDYKESNSELWTSTTFRMAIWSCAIEAIEKKPFVGYGTGGGQIALENVYKEKGFIRGELDKYNAHNEYLNTTLDLGIFSGVALLSFMIISLFIALRSKNPTATCFILAIAFCFCVESVLLRQKGIVFFSFFFSFLCWHLSPSKNIQNAV